MNTFSCDFLDQIYFIKLVGRHRSSLSCFSKPTPAFLFLFYSLCFFSSFFLSSPFFLFLNFSNILSISHVSTVCYNQIYPRFFPSLYTNFPFQHHMLFCCKPMSLLMISFECLGVGPSLDSLSGALSFKKL